MPTTRRAVGEDQPCREARLLAAVGVSPLMNLEDHAAGLKFVIRDRDARFTVASDAVFTAIGVRIIKTRLTANGYAYRRGIVAHSAMRSILLPEGRPRSLTIDRGA
jgi:hypothetical protein